jgi:hypothetical protein
MSWFFARSLHHVDLPVFRPTGGRHTFTSVVSGLPVMVMLTTTGKGSGKRRTALLVLLLGLIPFSMPPRRSPPGTMRGKVRPARPG